MRAPLTSLTTSLCDAVSVRQADGGRNEKLARLAADDLSRGASSAGAAAIPEALQSLSVDALLSICASQGLSVPKGSSKDEIVDLLEAKKGIPLHALQDKRTPSEEEGEEEGEEAGGAKGEEEEDGDEEDDENAE